MTPCATQERPDFKEDKKDKIITHECNILSNILNHIKHAKSKNSHYSPIIQGFTNTHSGRAKCINFPILLDSGRSSKIVMVTLTSKLKQKQSPEETTWKPNQGIALHHRRRT